MSNPSLRTRMSMVSTTARQAVSGVKTTSEMVRMKKLMTTAVVVSPWEATRATPKRPPTTAAPTPTISSIRSKVPNTDHQVPFTSRKPRRIAEAPRTPSSISTGTARREHT